MIETSVINIIENAIKYADSKEILVNVRINNHRCDISITDAGPGIKESEQRYIFDKFYRVPTGNIHNVKGFGLGLYYVKLIVESHKGDIAVKSTLNEGSVFTIKLPFS